MATVCVAIALVFFGPSGAARAEDDGTQAAPAQAPDEIDLRDGGFVAGRIIEFVPGSHLVIRSAAGADLRYTLDKVLAARRGGRLLGLTPSGDGQAAAVAEPSKKRELDQLLEAVPGPRVQLQLRSNVPALLQRRIGPFASEDASAYHVVCRLPCEATLPAQDPQPYRVGSIRYEPTEWFSVPRQDSLMDVRMVKKNWTLWAPGMAILGAAVSVIGTTLFVLNRTDVLEGDGWKWTSIGMSITAGALYTGAIGMWLFRPETGYELHSR